MDVLVVCRGGKRNDGWTGRISEDRYLKFEGWGGEPDEWYGVSEPRRFETTRDGDALVMEYVGATCPN